MVTLLITEGEAVLSALMKQDFTSMTEKKTNPCKAPL